MEHTLTLPTAYQEKEAEARRQLRALQARGESISLKKNAQHIFKSRAHRPNLDLRHFNQVLSVDTDRKIATVEGMATFYDLVEATLRFNLMPQAVPELRSITVGGVIAGLGGQSSSFKFGLVHEMVTGFDLLTGAGDVVHCSPDSHADLFHMLPNSYGSLGYVLKCDIKLNEVAPYVALDCRRFSEPHAFFEAMERIVVAGQADFVEGVSFSPHDFILLVGTFTHTLPAGVMPLVPLHTPFFKAVQDPANQRLFLPIKDYIWRWDPDAFWATDQQNLIGSVLLNPRFRKTLGRYLLRSDRLIKIGKARNRLRKKGIARFLFLEGKRQEALIQDAAIPFENAAAFDVWLAETLHIHPLWYCPVRTTRPPGTYPLYNPSAEFMVDFGFYISMALDDAMDDYFFNRQIERKLVELGGLKCLYSDTFYPKEQFWSIYNKPAYDRVKTTYDPRHAFLDLYEKVITRTD